MNSSSLVRTTFLAACVFFGYAVGRAEAQGPRTNVLLILIDDLNDQIGCLGGAGITPHIDRLAQRGTLFANAHTQAPWCAPSRTSLLTGKRPSTTGIYTLSPWFREVPALRGLVTLPQYFSAHGYGTFGAGKVFHDGHPPEKDAATEFDAMGYRGKHFPPAPVRPLVNAPGVRQDFGVFPEKDGEQEDWKVVDSAIAQLEKKRTKPFFISVGIRRPHYPLFASAHWFSLYDLAKIWLPEVPAADRDDLPRFAHALRLGNGEPTLPALAAAGLWRQHNHAYFACMSFADSQVGRLLEALEKTGEAERTIVVLTSDHGFHLGEKQLFAKRTLWERATRVPLIFAGPGVGRGTSRRTVELLDIYPTLAAACRLPAPVGTEGESLGALLRDPSAPRVRPAITGQMRGNFAVRSEEWRYIRYADGSEELYDHQRDPNEFRNLADDPQHAATKAEMGKWIPANPAEPVPGSERTAGGFLTYADGVARLNGERIEL